MIYNHFYDIQILGQVYDEGMDKSGLDDVKTNQSCRGEGRDWSR